MGEGGGAARLALTAVAAAVVGVLGAGAVVVHYLGRSEADLARHEAAAAANSAQIAREVRQRPVANLSLAPLPTALPRVGEPGTDPAGYPTAWVDRAALRSLLLHGKVDALTSYFEELQRAFEADPRHEYGPIDAGDAFASAEPELRPALDAWVAAKPTSFAPLLARGAHGVRVGFARRGARPSGDTHDDDFEGMAEAHARARADLEAALALRPSLTAALRYLVQMASAGSRLDPALIARATASCPGCFQIRVALIMNRAPRWGGSHEEMRKLAADADPARNPKFALLPGYVDLDQANTARRAGRWEEAFVAVERACARGEHWEFLEERAYIQGGRGKLDEAWKDAEAMARLRPGHPAVLERLLTVLVARQDWVRAASTWIQLVRMVPTEEAARRQRPKIVAGLLAKANAHAATDPDGALDLLDLAVTLDPGDRALRKRRTDLITPDGPLDDAKIAELARAVAERPDDFRAAQYLDYALVRRGELERILGIWNDYLARSPNDGRAYLERGGTQSRLKKRQEALADARRACELGVSEGCAIAGFRPYPPVAVP